MQPGWDAREDCQLHTLAKNHVAHIQRCSKCSALSVHLGPLTLRFDAAALESLWNVLGQALMQLHEEVELSAARQHTRVRAGSA